MNPSDATPELILDKLAINRNRLHATAETLATIRDTLDPLQQMVVDQSIFALLESTNSLRSCAAELAYVTAPLRTQPFAQQRHSYIDDELVP